MRKAFRIIAKVFSGVVIMLIIIPLLLSVAIRIDFVQNFVVTALANFASKKIDTKVSIGHISINGNLEVGITDFFVQDPNGVDTLLYSRHVSTKVMSLGILSGKVVLDNTVVSKGKLYLETDADKILNIKKVTDKLKPKTPSSSVFSMLIKDIALDTFNFRFREHDFPGVEDGINYKNLTLNNISGKVKNLDIVNDSINMNISGLNFLEQSGVKGEKIFIDKFTITSSMMLFEKGSLKIDSSFIDFRTIKMSYKAWDMSDFINKVPMNIDINKSEVYMATVAKFTMQPQKWNLKLSFSGRLDGVLSNAKGSIRYADTGSARITGAVFSMKGLPDINKTVFEVKAPNIEATTEGLYEIVDDFVPQGIGTLPKIVVPDAKLYALCSFNGTITDFAAKVTLHTLQNRAGGVAAASVNMKKLQNGSTSLSGKVETKNINLARYTNIDYIGKFSSSLTINGTFGGKNDFIKAEGNIGGLTYKSYHYTDIRLSALYANNKVQGYVYSLDRNLNFDLNGEVDLGGSVPRYNANLNLRNAALVKLNLNKRDSVSRLQGMITADISGTNLHNLVGGVLIDSVQYISNRDTIQTARDIKLSFNNNATTNQFSMRSDFIDADFKGVMGYTNIIGYFMESLRRFMPAFQNEKIDNFFSTNKIQRQGSADNMDNYYMLNINVKESNRLTNILVPGLSVADSTNLSLLFNPYDDIISLRIKSPGIAYNNTVVQGVTIDCHNENNALSLFTKINSLESGNFFIPNAIFVGNLENNVFDLSARFNNQADNTEAIIKTSTIISRAKSGNSLKINLMPSSFRIQDMTWSSNDSYITISPDSITFDHTNIYNNQQRLNIDGVIGNNLEDKITVELDNFNIETGKFIFQSLGYDIAGFLTGSATGYALKNKEYRKFESHIEFNDFNVNGTQLTPGIFDSWWDDSSRSILFLFDNQGKTLLDGSYTPRSNKYLANVKIDDFDVALVAPFMKTIVTDVGGSASVDVTLSNPKGYFAIDGVVDIPDFRGTILFTQVEYTISGKAIIKDNQYSIKNGLITDGEGGKAPFTAYMTNDKYKKVKYNFDLHPESMLVLDLSPAQNDIFYGKAYATGRVTVDGDRNNVLLDVTATTAKQSTFFLPLNNKMTISDVDFIKFVKREITEKIQRSFISSTKKASELNTSFAISLNLNIQPNLEAEIVIDPITGSSIKATGSGNLSLHIVPKDQVFTMNGDYVISQGTYRFILPNFNLVDKYFTIKPGGWIRWSGDPLGAILNVEAIYKLKASLAPILTKAYATRVNVECILSLRNSLLNPIIKLGIELPDASPEIQSQVRGVLSTEEDVSTQLFFLLFSNSFYAVSTSDATNTNIGAAVGAATGIEFFTNQIKNLISTNKFDFGINYRPKDEGADTSSELELSVSAPLLENKLYLDVEGNYNFKDNPNSANTSNPNDLSGDFSLTWVIDKSGDLQLKGFSRTIDTFNSDTPYDENLGTQESGVGIYYKASFNKFSDIVTRYKKYWAERPERRKEREKEREAKKEKRAEAKKKK